MHVFVHVQCCPIPSHPRHRCRGVAPMGSEDISVSSEREGGSKRSLLLSSPTSIRSTTCTLIHISVLSIRVCAISVDIFGRERDRAEADQINMWTLTTLKRSIPGLLLDCPGKNSDIDPFVDQRNERKKGADVERDLSEAILNDKPNLVKGWPRRGSTHTHTHTHTHLNCTFFFMK
jgi:hypothetical protein